MSIFSLPPFRRTCLLFAAAVLLAMLFLASPGADGRQVDCTEVTYNDAIVQQCRPGTNGDGPATPTPTVAPDDDPDVDPGADPADDPNADDEATTIDPRRPKDRGERGSRVGAADAEDELDALAQAAEDAAAAAAQGQDDDDPDEAESGDSQDDDDDPDVADDDGYVPGDPQESTEDAIDDGETEDGSGLTTATETNDSSTNTVVVAAMAGFVAIGLGFIVAARRNRAVPDRPTPDDVGADD